jgi:hypothetical protein
MTIADKLSAFTTIRYMVSDGGQVKHMWWFKEGGRCECRCRRASLPLSR